MQAVESSTRLPSVVVAMNDRPERYPYGSRVKLQIDRNDLSSYVSAARKLSQMPVDVINVQHEYGLFGGEWGEYLLELYHRASQPIVTTLHSVIPNPGATLRRVTRALADGSGRLIVLANAATDILAEDYGIARSKIHMIPHGIPTITQPTRSHVAAKLKLGYHGRTVLSTFGLIGPGKGIEFAIRALPTIVSAHPDVLYLVIGQTHPGVRAHEGEAYRTGLQDLVRELNVHGNVEFVDQYLTLPQLMDYLLATDVYVIPYLNPTQIVSGTLAYALGCGKAVVSTPFIHAREVLARGMGSLVPFRDSEALTVAINYLLENPLIKQTMEARAFASSRSWIWPAVAEQYVNVYEEVALRELPVAVF